MKMGRRRSVEESKVVSSSSSWAVGVATAAAAGWSWLLVRGTGGVAALSPAAGLLRTATPQYDAAVHLSSSSSPSPSWTESRTTRQNRMVGFGSSKSSSCILLRMTSPQFSHEDEDKDDDSNDTRYDGSNAWNTNENIGEFRTHDDNALAVTATASSIATTATSTRNRNSNGNNSQQWSVTDHWGSLSSDESSSAATPATTDPFGFSDGTKNGDDDNPMTTLAALRMQNFGMPSHETSNDETEQEESVQDAWLRNAIENFMVAKDPDCCSDDDKGETDSKNGKITTEKNSIQSKEDPSTAEAVTGFSEDSLGREIALLVRCNENPHQMLLEQGRFVPELTLAQRDDIQQLLELPPPTTNNDEQQQQYSSLWQPTVFLKEAVHALFERHAVASKDGKHHQQQHVEDDEAFSTTGSSSSTATKVMNAHSVSSWMSTCLPQEELVGVYDKRVTQTLARHGRLGSMTESDLLQFYVVTLSGSDETTSNKNSENGNGSPWTTVQQLTNHRQPEIQAVWRDLRQHGLVGPAEFERTMRLVELRELSSNTDEDNTLYQSYNVLDECEILDDHVAPTSEASTLTDRQGKSSHERLELYRNVPVWMRDGDFVFIDEQSCIGCMQCTSAAPASFQMLDHTGRARTFAQRKSPDVKTAVASCPVDCMHYVSYDELKELELARDEGSSSGILGDDHRHFGHSSTRGYIAPTPLHVSRRDSDANHRSSFYHFLRNQCFKSTQCPQKGCFDCPRYKDDPGGNPHFKERLTAATHVRAEYFKKTGIADSYRRTADI